MPFFQQAGSTLTNTRMNSNYLNGGLELIGGNSFSGTAVRITQFMSGITSPFIARNRSYRLVIFQTTSAASSEMFLKMRVGGVDNSTNYHFAGTSFSETAVSTIRNGSAVTTGIRIGSTNTTASLKPLSATIDIFNPQEARDTGFIVEAREAAGMYSGGGFHDVATAFNSFSLVCGSSMTGRFMLYGWRKSTVTYNDATTTYNSGAETYDG